MSVNNIHTRFSVYLTFALLAALPCGAQDPYENPNFFDPSYYETVLVPLALRTPAIPLRGEAGSLWSVLGVVRNAAPEKVWFNNNGTACHVAYCEATLPPEETHDLSPIRGRVEGYLYHVERIHADEVFFDVRLNHVSGACNSDISIPVVRENDFLTKPYDFVDVVLNTNSRTMLRLYDPDAKRVQRAIRVLMTDRKTNAVLLDTVVPIQYHATDNVKSGFEPHPNYAAIQHMEAYATAPTQNVRIRLEPTDDQTKYWAMISTTNNQTQSVRLYWPN